MNDKQNKKTVCCICQNTIEQQSDNNINMCYECETLKLYIDYILSIDILEKECVTISTSRLKHINTTHLMSRLRHCYGSNPVDENNKPVDVLYIDDFLEEYVVVYDIPYRFINMPRYGSTLTKLKQKGFSFLRYGDTCEESICVDLNEEYSFHIWRYPYLLKARTISNMNYGDRWEAGVCVEEGNKYGDTSRFYIIGYIVRK